MNARALRRLELGMPNDVYVINQTATFQLLNDIHDWRVGRIDNATQVVQLPNANGGGSAIILSLGIAATNMQIKVPSGAAYQGVIDIGVVASTNKNVFTGSGNHTITLNGGTTGGSNVGDIFYFFDIKTNVWAVVAETIGSGSIATPFS